MTDYYNRICGRIIDLKSSLDNRYLFKLYQDLEKLYKQSIPGIHSFEDKDIHLLWVGFEIETIIFQQGWNEFDPSIAEEKVKNLVNITNNVITHLNQESAQVLEKVETQTVITFHSDKNPFNV